MHKDTLMTRMAPYIRQQARVTTPSIRRAGFIAYTGGSITRDEWDSIQRARTAADTINEYEQALLGQWEHYAAGIIYNAETTI